MSRYSRLGLLAGVSEESWWAEVKYKSPSAISKCFRFGNLAVYADAIFGFLLTFNVSRLERATVFSVVFALASFSPVFDKSR